MLQRRQMLLLPLIACAPAVRAQLTIEGQVFPGSVALGGQTLALNGVGMRAVAWLKGYVAGLYLPQRTADAERAVAMPGPKRLQMRMLQDVPAAEFVKAVDKGFARNVPAATQPAVAARREAFNGQVTALGQVKKGDVVDLDFVPGTGMRFSVNGRLRGEPIPGEDFYAGMLLIFLGPKPVDPRLKSGLLGQPVS